MEVLAAFATKILTPAGISVTAFGLIVGSFLNVFIYRVPLGIFWKTSRSFCPACQRQLSWMDNVPVLSYLFLRGRARCCKTRISLQYPLVELVSSLFAAAYFAKFPFVTGDFGAFSPPEFLRWIHAYVFTCALIGASVIDFHHMIIPDVLSLSLIALTPLVALVHPDLDLISASIGVLIGGGCLYLLQWLYLTLRREIGLGMGDVKLLAGIGGWLGYQCLLPTILYGSITGAIVGLFGILVLRRLSWRSAIPFGPFLALGALLYFWFGNFALQGGHE